MAAGTRSAVDLLERRSRRQGGGDGVWISTHEDELLRIEEDLGDAASYPGRDTFYNLR